MNYQIHLVDKSQGHIYYFVKSDSKENALAALIRRKELNLEHYSTVLVVDLHSQIIIDDLNEDTFNIVLREDHLESYDRVEQNSFLMGRRIQRILEDK